MRRASFASGAGDFRTFPPRFREEDRKGRGGLAFPSVECGLPKFVAVFTGSRRVLVGTLLLAKLLFVLVLPKYEGRADVLPLLQSMRRLVPVCTSDTSILLSDVRTPSRLASGSFTR